MKKFFLTLFLVVIFGAAAYGIYLYTMAPHQVVCARLVQLCELEDPSALDSCTDGLAQGSERDAESMRKAADCAVEAESCAEVSGCIVGAGMNMGIKEITPLLKQGEGLVDDFLKGVGKSAEDLLK